MILAFWTKDVMYTDLPVSPLRSESPMSVAFRQRTVEEIREELRQMSDAELLKHGRSLRALCRPDPHGDVEEAWMIQLKEAREEWKRRHPRTGP